MAEYIAKNQKSGNQVLPSDTRSGGEIEPISNPN